MDSYVIWTKDLTKKFGDFISVNKINIQVKSGEIYGFIGANGAGKTTTIRMLCGILEPTSGEGRVAGYDIFTEQDKIKQNIGYMSQKFSLYPELTVDENINFYCGAYKISNQQRKIAKARAYDISRLQNFKNNLTRDLPTGWKQRLALACALLHEPNIVFLDEPTAGVDPISRREFWDLIYELSNQGITVFVTTHFLDEAEHCTKIGLINNGKIIAQDSPSKIKSLYNYNIFEIHTTDNLKLYDYLIGEDRIHGVFVFGNCLHISIDKKYSVEEILKPIAERNSIILLSVEKIPPTLEDIFIELIEQKSVINNE